MKQNLEEELLKSPNFSSESDDEEQKKIKADRKG